MIIGRLEQRDHAGTGRIHEPLGITRRRHRRLHRGDVALEQSIALYERGAALKAHCAGKLKDAEAKVEMIRVLEGRAVGTSPAEGM